MESSALQAELLAQGLNLMLLGMGTVFVFLTILVLVTSFMSSVLQKYAPAVSVDSVDSVDDNIAVGGKVDEHHLLAVISAAIHAHRSKQ